MPFQKIESTARRTSKRLEVQAKEKPAQSKPPIADLYEYDAEDQQTLLYGLDKYSERGEFRVLIYLKTKEEDCKAMLGEDGKERDFPRFQLFPLEIRQEIMLHALPGPRVLEFVPTKYRYRFSVVSGIRPVEIEEYKKKCTPPVGCPAHLHVNKEWRALGLRFYQPLFRDYLPNSAMAYMDVTIDIVFLNLYEGPKSFFRGSSGLVPLGRSDLKLVRNLALTGRCNDMQRLKYFSGLEKLTVRDALHCNGQTTLSDVLAAAWAKLAKKKRNGITNATLQIEQMTGSDLMQLLRWDGAICMV